MSLKQQVAEEFAYLHVACCTAVLDQQVTVQGMAGDGSVSRRKNLTYAASFVGQSILILNVQDASYQTIGPSKITSAMLPFDKLPCPEGTHTSPLAVAIECIPLSMKSWSAHYSHMSGAILSHLLL